MMAMSIIQRDVPLRRVDLWSSDSKSLLPSTLVKLLQLHTFKKRALHDRIIVIEILDQSASTRKVLTVLLSSRDGSPVIASRFFFWAINVESKHCLIVKNRPFYAFYSFYSFHSFYCFRGTTALNKTSQNLLIETLFWFRKPGQAAEQLTPGPESGLNPRTRVHEYGGGESTLGDGVIFFSNFAWASDSSPH